MNEQLQQMMALAQQQRGVAVGGCGPQMYYNPNGEGAAPGNGNGSVPGIPGNGFPGNGYPPDMGPGCNPYPPPVSNMVQPCAILQTCLTPLGINFGVDAAGNVYNASLIGTAAAAALAAGLAQPFFQLFTRNSTYQPCGVSFFSAPDIVLLDSVQAGDTDTNYMLAPTDIASWNTTECFCPVSWGCISSIAPLRIAAHSILTGSGSTNIQAVRGTLIGTRRSSMYGCGPNLGCP